MLIHGRSPDRDILKSICSPVSGGDVALVVGLLCLRWLG
jgi:hypothetical protein